MESFRDGDIVTFQGPYAGIELEFVQGSYLVNYRHKDFEFYLNINSDSIQFIDQFGKSHDGFQQVQSFGFEGRERMLSNRGYIWSRSLPLLKNTLFIGTGADVYPFNFPQTDIVGKVNAFGYYDIIVDKPHNMYLQTAIQFGIIFTMGLVSLIFFHDIKFFWK